MTPQIFQGIHLQVPGAVRQSGSPVPCSRVRVPRNASKANSYDGEAPARQELCHQGKCEHRPCCAQRCCSFPPLHAHAFLEDEKVQLVHARQINGPILLLHWQVDEWVDYSSVLAVGAEFERACTYMDSYLLPRTFFAGYTLTIADIAIFVGLLGACS